MKRLTTTSIFAGLLALAWTFAPAPGSAQGERTSGEGKYKFRVMYTSDHLPEEARKVLKAAHGGFAVDRRPGKGETYFALPGAGIVRISSDMKSTRMIDTPDGMKGTNMHNTTIWTAPDGTPYLSFPGNQSNKVYVTTLDGKMVATLGPPDGAGDTGHPVATKYFQEKGTFIPTDTEQLDGMLYVATGYSKLDYVLTARISSWSPFKMDWHDLAFGGKGKGVGQFGTGHGITIPPGTKRLDIADRPNSEIDRFTRHGQYISTLETPKGSLPCDTYYLDNLLIVGALDGPDRTKGAPVYIYEDDQLAATIMAKEDLGLPNFLHIHNAVARRVNGKLYVIAQAWNPGDFAIFEQVM